ncbi:MAG: NADP-dependent malic enzyme [Bacteroidetes bacterium]|nr:MAG: NADP-dependent malic enzyme [Bacteroidota bacterium]
MENRNESLRKAALAYHDGKKKGKIEINPTKPFATQYDLSLAYTPGVAEPCLEIQRDPALARKYTAKGNLVAVISNGTAVLGLGNIGALAGKPVMEGKAILFKRFADIDVFDIEVDTEDPDAFIDAVKLIAPTFGGINLEDIKAPECFYIEERLKKELDIPVFHDDQHGTAIISGAALINAVLLTGKNMKEIKVVFSGAGAAGIACANFYLSLGVDPANVLMTDSKGVLWNGRGDEDKNRYKAKFFRDTDARTLGDAMRGADVFCGVSAKGVLSKEMVKTMGEKPIIFAMANPDPEITYDDAREARPDAIVATGRSDYPNQVNNVLGFPFIFRATLDVEASSVNEEMKLAVAHALADLAREEVPDSVKRAYDEDEIVFGPDYIIPKPFDHRVLIHAASAVAKAAMESGVAKKMVDLDEYRENLLEHLEPSRDVMRKFHNLAKRHPKRVVFPEGSHPKILQAACEIVREGIAVPILLTKNRDELLKEMDVLGLPCKGIEIIEPKNAAFREEMKEKYYAMRQRKGITQSRAEMHVRNYFYFGAMMVESGRADAMLGGIGVNFPEVLKPALRVVGTQKGGNLVAGMFFVLHNNKLYCLADCAVNINPDARDLAEIALLSAREMESLHIEPRVAMLSFSNFGSVRTPETEKIVKAIEIFKQARPDIPIDGPVQADFALNPSSIKQHFPFSSLKKRANLLVFPNLDAGNISLRLMRVLSNAHQTGPILLGMKKPVQLLNRNSEVHQIVDLAAIASVDAYNASKGKNSFPKLINDEPYKRPRNIVDVS